MVIFYDQASLTKLWNKPTWAIDGTFSVVPKPFFQLFTISFIENNSIFPVVFSLLINKNGTTYKKLFQILIELNGRPTPTLIKTDFEQASISAARSQFPNAKISGCLFHLGQAIQRRIAEEGLKKYYNDNPFVRKHIKELMALSFVPIECIKPLFEELYNRARFPDRLKPIYDYFSRNYIEGIITTRYPRDIWSCYTSFVVEIKESTMQQKAGT